MGRQINEITILRDKKLKNELFDFVHKWETGKYKPKKQYSWNKKPIKFLKKKDFKIVDVEKIPRNAYDYKTGHYAVEVQYEKNNKHSATVGIIPNKRKNKFYLWSD